MVKKKKKPSQKSKLEEKFLAVWMKYCPYLPAPRRQKTFHKKRMWRFDFCWPEYKIAVEIQGGSYMNRPKRKGKFGRWTQGAGGHNSAIGQANDYEKFRAATKLGWKLFPFNTHELQENLGKGKRTKRGKIKYTRKFTIYDCVNFVADELEKAMNA